MPNFLSKLTHADRVRLLEELNYMNLDELRGFCISRGIPYTVVAEHTNGKTKITKDADDEFARSWTRRIRRRFRHERIPETARLLSRQSP